MQTYRVEFSHYDSGPQVNKLDQVPSDGHQMSLAGAGQGGTCLISREIGARGLRSRGECSRGLFKLLHQKTVF